MALFRRYLKLWCLCLVFFLFLVIKPFTLQLDASRFNVAKSSRGVIGPNDSIKNRLKREWTPKDDTAPFPHEPVGFGTLRDVREERFYRGGTATIETNTTRNPGRGPAIYDPYPEYNSRPWKQQWKGTFRPCEGPLDGTLSRREPKDMMLAYRGVQKDFPFPLSGSYEALGFDGSTCTTRASRLEAYGYSDAPQNPNPRSRSHWDLNDWKYLQSQCFARNSDRYTSGSKAGPRSVPVLPLEPQTESSQDTWKATDQETGPFFKPRSAVVLRAWHGLSWTENLKAHVRSLIMELSLHSGGEYEVFLLTHVEDDDIPSHNRGSPSEQIVRQLKEKYIPREFRDMTVFFNERVLQSWYPKVREHKPEYQHFQPIQLFSILFPHFDFYWQLEMDARLTGHAYHFLEQSSAFAKEQPRKHLWERNAHFYIPGVHGDYMNFTLSLNTSMEENGKGKESIWGPKPPSRNRLNIIGPTPPTPNPNEDDFSWGVGEDADLITFLPIFDPTYTKWVFASTLFNLPRKTPRRASPVTMGRFSRRLLHSIHDSQVHSGIGLGSEMTPSSFALWHGLKAVHVPQPIYADGKWTPKELDRILNQGERENMNGGEGSFWNWDHKWDHVMYRLSYMFTGQTGEDLYRRWLGIKVDGGQVLDGSIHQDPQGRNWFDSGDLREDLYGPLCFPPMLLHPVKNTEQKKGNGMAVPV